MFSPTIQINLIQCALKAPPSILVGQPLILNIDWNPNKVHVDIDPTPSTDDSMCKVSKTSTGQYLWTDLDVGVMCIRETIALLQDEFNLPLEIVFAIQMWESINKNTVWWPLAPKAQANPLAQGQSSGAQSGKITRAFNGKRSFGENYPLRIDRGNGWEEFANWTELSESVKVSRGSLRYILNNAPTTGKYAGWKVERM